MKFIQKDSILKKEIPRKFIYIGYAVIIFITLIVGSLYIAKATSGLGQNKCVNEGGQWNSKEQKCTPSGN